MPHEINRTLNRPQKWGKSNLTAQQAPAACFGWLYHQRWRVEEAFKRLKHRLKIEAVSGLSQHAVMVDVAAKILADNLASLLAGETHTQAGAAQDQPCNMAHAVAGLQRVLPRVLLAIGDFLALIEQAMTTLARSIKRRKPGRSAPRAGKPVKPHPSIAYKG